jgi:hypothetical protein
MSITSEETDKILSLLAEYAEQIDGEREEHKHRLDSDGTQILKFLTNKSKELADSIAALQYLKTHTGQTENTYYPPLVTDGNRPVTYEWHCDKLKSAEKWTNAVTIYADPNEAYNESGLFDGRRFHSMTITREEIHEMAKNLDEDARKMAEYEVKQSQSNQEPRNSI